MAGKIIVTVIFALVMSACVQSYIMTPHRASDSVMPCKETAQRIAELNAIKQLVLKEKNTKNTLAGVLFFPAINSNKSNVQQTIAAVSERKKVLSEVYKTSQCAHDIPVYSTEQIKEMISNNQVRELKS